MFYLRIPALDRAKTTKNKTPLERFAWLSHLGHEIWRIKWSLYLNQGALGAFYPALNTLLNG